MSQTLISRLRLAWTLIMSALVAVVGALFIWAALDIYQSGPQPYTAEAIAAHFDIISLPVYLTILWAAGGGILLLALPAAAPRLRGNVPPAVTLARLSAKAPAVPAPLAQRIRRERLLRSILTGGGVLLYVAGAAIALRYVLDPANFAGDDFNGDIMAAAIVVGLCMLLPFALSVALIYLNRASRLREIALFKTALATPTAGEPVQDSVSLPCQCRASARLTAWADRHGRTALTIARCAILLLGVALVIAGIFNGGLDDVLSKAINICTECIGLG